MSGLRARSACIAMMLAAMAPLLAGCDESSLPRSPLPKPPNPTSASSPSSRSRARWCANCRAASRRRAFPTCARASPASSSSACSARAARSRPAIRSTGSIRGRSRSRCSRTEAALAQAPRPRSKQAAQQARRIATLTSQRAAPEAENEKAIAAERQAAADVEGRKADLARARLNLDYATIRAPIDGIVGAALVSEGALVVQNDTATLATIQQLDPIYADFTQSVTELNQLRRAFESGDLDRIAPDADQGPPRARRRHALSASPASCCSRTPRSTPIPGR